jgi:hypothetical protein
VRAYVREDEAEEWRCWVSGENPAALTNGGGFHDPSSRAAQRENLEVILREGDFLLVIAGNDITEDLRSPRGVPLVGDRYWEGASVVSGTHRGRAFVEMMGFCPFSTRP